MSGGYLTPYLANSWTRLTVGVVMPAQSQSHATKNASLCPREVIVDLRTDHAGETGALCNTQGVLQFAGNQGVRAFTAQHPRASELLSCPTLSGPTARQRYFMTRTPHSYHSSEFKEQALLTAKHRGTRLVISIADELNMSAGTQASGCKVQARKRAR